MHCPTEIDVNLEIASSCHRVPRLVPRGAALKKVAS